MEDQLHYGVWVREVGGTRR